MPISQILLPEFDQEMTGARKTLERVPEDKFGWKPHEKSMTLGRLAQHLSEIPGWVKPTLEQDSLDFSLPYQPPPIAPRAQMLEAFDKSVAEARALMAATGDERLAEPWSLSSDGKTLFTMPRIAVLRGMIMNHLIHHRAQLGVYLRLNDVPVPALYGPSADENG